MKHLILRRAPLREILGRNKVGFNPTLYLGLEDSKFGPVIIKSPNKDFPNWHFKHLIGEEIDYVLAEDEFMNHYGRVVKYDYQNLKLKIKLMDILVNKGQSGLRKYRFFDEKELEGENNIYMKALLTKRNLELNLEFETCSEIL